MRKLSNSSIQNNFTTDNPSLRFNVITVGKTCSQKATSHAPKMGAGNFQH